MKTNISLNGLWRMGYCDIGAGTPEGFAAMETLPYSVPGDVHTPLIDAGVIAEPLEGVNDLDCRWVEEKEFWCERRFTLTDAQLLPVMRLTFEGLDCTADVWLNGAFLGRCSNAFVEHAWEVRQHLRAGENMLLVRIDQGLAEAQTHDLERMGVMWNNDQPWRVWMRKPQYVYSWDWTIWLASCGVWRGVSLTGYDRGSITDVYARVADAEVAEGKPCRVAVDVEADVREAGCLLRCRILDQAGEAVAEANAPLTEALALTIPQARLWWCNGMGESYLYTVEAALLAADGTPLDVQTQRLGLRTIALIEPEFADGDTGFTFVLNGERVFCKGANHVPCDCLPGRITPEKERALVALARDEHMNMLRVWGGGVYSSEAFMEACDEAGVMVWHDFMYACGYYPDHDPGFAASITDEARKAIRRLRRHASLIGWAGNNEIQEMYGSQKQHMPDLPWYGGTIYEKILPSLVQELCPTLVYRPSSPHGGACQGDCHHGDQHIWLLTHVTSHPHYMDLWRFTEFPVKFFSEFGVMGAMTLETAQSCIPADHMRPGDPVWQHHTNSCMGGVLLEKMEKQYFGDAPHSPQQYILRSQAIQAEITRHIYEEFRRQKFTCSGLLFWTLGDSYGVHNWSLIDYQLRRKPVYHALKQAMAPLALCVRGYDVQNDEGRQHYRDHWQNAPAPLEVWGMNDELQDASATLEYAVLTTKGRVLLSGRQDVTLPANASIRLAEVDVAGVIEDPAETVLRVRLLQGGRIINESRYFFAPFAQMVARDAAVTASCRPVTEGAWEVTLTADRFVWMLHLAEPEGVEYEENDFELWPGEAKTIIVHAADAAFRPVLRWMGQED